MPDKRKHRRHTRRMEVEFSHGGTRFTGLSSNISEQGMFIRTRNAFVKGTPVDIVIYLSNGKHSRLKGVVKRAVKTNSRLIKNGMGIELTERDDIFMEFLNAHSA